MNDCKAGQDRMGTFKSMYGEVIDGLVQGWSPLIEHVRTCSVWSTPYFGFYQAVNINTETLIVRASLKAVH